MAILTILTAIGTFLLGVGGQIIDALQMTFEAIWKLIKTFLEVAPKPLKILVFLFLLVSVGNIFSNFFLGSSYACTSTNLLYQTPNILEGIGNSIRFNFFGWTIGETDSFIRLNYDRVTSSSGITNVQCVSEAPKLYFYSIDVFNYYLWLLILILLYGTPMVLGYYSKMGVLH